jgi:fibronectin-binding autotransporter adhesin
MISIKPGHILLPGDRPAAGQPGSTRFPFVDPVSIWKPTRSRIMKTHRDLFLGSLLAAALTHASTAASLEWAGSTTGLATGSSNTWDTASLNWWDGATNVAWPAASTSDDDAVFGGTAGAVTIATGGVIANNLAFNTTGYTLSGAALTLDGADPGITTGTGISATISSVISGAAGLAKAGEGTLVLSGANNFTGAATISAGTLRAGNAAALGSNLDGTTIGPGATLDVNGQNLGTEIVTVSGDGVGGLGAIVNSGAGQINALGRLVLAGDTTFGGPARWDLRNSSPTLDMGGFTLTKTGANYLGLIAATVNNPGTIIVNQGELSISTATTLGGGSGNSISVNAGGILSFYQSASAHAWTLNLASGAILRGENGSGTQNTWSGPVNVSGEVTLQADGALTLANTVSGTANLTKTGGSTLTVAAGGSLAHTGNLTLNAGTLTVNGSLAHTGSLILNAGAIANLNGPASFTGFTRVTAGTLTLNYATDDFGKLPDSEALVLIGATINLNGGTHVEEVASTTLAAGTSSTVGSTGHTGYLAMKTISQEYGASVNFTAPAIASTFNSNTADGILGPWATVGGTDWAANAGDGTVVAYAGYVLSSDPAVLDDADAYLGQHVKVDSSQTPDDAIAPLSLVFSGAAANTLTLQGTNTLASGGLLVGSGVGANPSVITGGGLAGPADGDLVLNQRNAAGPLTIDSTIANNPSGATALVKTGPGIVVLNAANSYSGQTTVAAGSLQVNDSSAIGGSMVVTGGTNSAALLLGDGVVVPPGKSIVITGPGANQFFGALSTATGSTGASEWQGPVIIGEQTLTRIGTLGGTLVVSGPISEVVGGSQLLVRNNESVGGSTVLSGANTFSGGVHLVVGNLRMGGPGALGSGPLTLGGGTNVNAFSSDSSTPRTIANPVILNGTTTHNLGHATFDGKLTFTGPVALGTATRTVAANSLVEINGVIGSTGAAGLTKIGSADLILSGANTYAGPTSINGGTLVVAHKDALAATSSVFPSTTAGSGTLRLAIDESMTIGRLESSSSNPGTVLSDRATPGPGLNHVFQTAWLGANTYTFAAGPNVTSGTAAITLNSVNLTAGGGGAATINPTTAVLTIPGPVNIGLNNLAKTLGLGGTSTGNLVSGVVSNGLNTLSVLKSGPGTWELSGPNSYSGTTIVRQGTLTLSGNRSGNAIGAITVCDTAGLDATLNISAGTHNLGTGQMNVGNSPTTPATATVNQSGGSVLFGAGGGNQLLVGQNATGNRGIYNLSGGSLTIGLSTSAGRGVMLGVNTGASGGTFNLSGTGALNMTAASGGTGNATLQVGRYDSAANNTTNEFNQTGGTANVGVLSIGGNGATGTGISSTLTLTGGAFAANVFARMAAGNTNAAAMTIGGTAVVTLPAFPTTRGTGSTATLNFNGGTLMPAASSTAYIGGLTNAFIQAGGARIDTNNFTITVSQALLTDPVSSGGGLTKDGGGTLNLTGANTYTGPTTVTAGTLSLGNGTTNTSLADAANVSVAAPATIDLNFTGTDTVNALWLAGARKAAGVWGAVGSGAQFEDARITGTGTLTVTSGPTGSDYDTLGRTRRLQPQRRPRRRRRWRRKIQLQRIRLRPQPHQPGLAQPVRRPARPRHRPVPIHPPRHPRHHRRHLHLPVVHHPNRRLAGLRPGCRIIQQRNSGRVDHRHRSRRAAPGAPLVHPGRSHQALSRRNHQEPRTAPQAPPPSP